MAEPAAHPREPAARPWSARRDGACVVVVTNIVTPYTHRLYEALGREPGLDLHVLTCAEREPGRFWEIEPAASYRRRTLAGLRWHRSYLSHVYFNPGVVAALVRLRPEVVVVNDFSPTMMLAAAAGRLLSAKVVIASDTQPETDPGAHSRIHRAARRLIVGLSTAAIGGSHGALAVLERFGLPRDRGVFVPVVPAFDAIADPPPREARPYDVLFCGHIDEERKGARFFVDVVRRAARHGRRLRVRIVGDGPLRSEIEEAFAALGVDATFDGFLQHRALAAAYASAKLFLFPSRGDPWGLVANEAAQCGTPSIVSPHARVAHEFVEPFGCGEVLDLDAEQWARTVCQLLRDPSRWLAAHHAAEVASRCFSLGQAAAAYLDALRLACDEPQLPIQRRTHRCAESEPDARK